jgi:hypothetical protein
MAAEPETNEPAAAAAPATTGFLGRLGMRWKALRKRLSDHFAEYGVIAVLIYLAIFLATWFGFTIAIRSGASIDGTAGETGSIGAAYLATQLTKPLRILATLAVTPFAAMLWDRIRGRKPALADASAAAPAVIESSAPPQPEPPER